VHAAVHIRRGVSTARMGADVPGTIRR
jgi:hypothetical protein